MLSLLGYLKRTGPSFEELFNFPVYTRSGQVCDVLVSNRPPGWVLSPAVFVLGWASLW